ncbi:MAG: lanosterol synthase [Myxococcota bacterium]|jgi:lanosterol synthase
MPTSTQHRPPTNPGQSLVRAALDKGATFLRSRQLADGSLAGEVIWCPMLAAQYVIAHHAMNRPIADERVRRLRIYFDGQQRQDGGYGLHAESDSYLFTTVLVYVALRLLGQTLSDPTVAAAADWLRPRDVTGVPTWGKLWLAIAGVYDWDGVNPVPPEIWLVPKRVPGHPSSWYSHTRLIYLGFSYIYGARITARETPVTLAIRSELYTGDYASIDWSAARHRLHDDDVFVAPDLPLKAAYRVLGGFEWLMGRQTRLGDTLRKKALASALKRVVYEVRSTNFACISPVNGLLNALTLHHARHADLDSLVDGLEHWVWEDDAVGFRLAGASSNTWDTSFAVAALCDGATPERYTDQLRSLQSFLHSAQIRDELPGDFEQFDRVSAVGGFCFGRPHHRWPVSDCTAEAILADLSIERILGDVADSPRLTTSALADGVRFILARQNGDGGFGSYEPQRGTRLLERVNPSEMFGNCMTEYSYLECTSSCVQALARALEQRGGELRPELSSDMEVAVRRGLGRVRALQNEDGSWQGIWGVNYIYGTLFGVSAIMASGASARDSAVVRACRWIVDHQLPGGGWGESIASCTTDRYTPTPTPQVIMTSWAMMTLITGGARGRESSDALRLGADYLLSSQQRDGNWPVQGQAGIFFHTAGLHYDLYRAIFPVWALGAYQRRRLEV